MVAHRISSRSKEKTLLMKNRFPGILYYSFIILALIASISAGNHSNIFAITKCLLMPCLILLLWCNQPGTSNKGLIIAGLFFSWLGDVLLLFDSSPLFFIGGLASFLITHVLYICYFINIKSANKSLLQLQPWIAALVAGYGISFILFLWPYLHEMKWPVMLYTTVICTMLVCSLHVFTKVNRPANGLFICGALLFAVSDSLLAVNKFYKPFAGAGMLIILTYCAAQFLIVLAAIKRSR